MRELHPHTHTPTTHKHAHTQTPGTHAHTRKLGSAPRPYSFLRARINHIEGRNVHAPRACKAYNHAHNAHHTRTQRCTMLQEASCATYYINQSAATFHLHSQNARSFRPPSIHRIFLHLSCTYLSSTCNLLRHLAAAHQLAHTIYLVG